MPELSEYVASRTQGLELVNPDADLIERCQARDENAFRELAERYRTRVASIAYKVLGNYQDAQDVTQEVFIKLDRGIGRFDPQKKFFTWLYRLTVNAAIDFLRTNKRRSHDTSIDEKPEQYLNIPSSEFNVITFNFERKELRQLFRRLAEDLSPTQKKVFVMCDLDGYTSDEAIEMLQCKKVTLRWWLHTARKKIRAEIAEKYPEYLREHRW